VTDGVVKLLGHVDSLWQKSRAEDLTSLVPGVRDIRNKLAVVPTENRDDREIAARAVKALELNPDVDASRIDIKVEGGTLLLSGAVPSETARRTALDSLGIIAGIRDVRDMLMVETENAAGK
jgi:osmotically-inducible protein OsmY